MATSDSYTVTRHAHVDAPPATVRAWVIDFHRWEAWSPWEDVDPALQRTYGGADQGVGAWYEWSGNRKAGQGRMEIVAADGRSITIDLHFLKPFKSQSDTVFTFDPAGDGTDVTWSMTGAKTFVTRVMGLFSSMDKLVGPDFEKGLGRLKRVAEAQDDPRASEPS